MKHTRGIVFAGFIVLLLGIGIVLLVWANRPLGQSLALRTPTLSIPATTVQTLPTATDLPLENTPTTVASVGPAATQTVTPTEVAKVCGNSGSMHLLMLGLTTPTNEDQLGADAIRMVTIDFDHSSATILTLPALLWVDTSSSLADLKVKNTELASVYLRAYVAAKGSTDQVRGKKATQAMAQTIIDNFGFVPDHFITISDRIFVKSVDALGGIEINLPQAVDGRSEGYGIYPAGPQVLTGTRALNFTRLFHPGGINNFDVWGNLGRQNLVVKAILETTLKPQNWTKIPTLVNEFNQSVITDLSPSQMLDLACIAEKAGETTQMLTVDEKMVKLDSLDRMIPDVQAIKNLVTEMDSGD